ncbi:MAG TPA: copper resistance CopC family protein [Candidatus Binatia bacterium]|jgi:methionine-rich copper-binding protein CopC|nr:copper resistance CopC family protein [Candidatus Binatia bacterium]
MSRGLAAAFAVASVLALRAPPAAAHAFLDHAEPRVGSTVEAPPALTLVFTEPIEAAFSHVTLTGPHGERIALPAPETPAPERLVVRLPALAPGEYTVAWGVVSVDTHATEGRFTFSVKAR